MIVDHDARRLVWAAPGHGKAVLRGFFDALGPERSAAITHVSADAAEWIADVVTERAPGAVRCADPFHVVAWATDALDWGYLPLMGMRTRGPVSQSGVSSRRLVSTFSRGSDRRGLPQERAPAGA